MNSRIFLYIFLFLYYSLSFGQSIRIIQQNDKFIDVELTFNISTYKPVDNSNKFVDITGDLIEVTYPNLDYPVYYSALNFGVPSNNGNNLRILNSQSHKVKGNLRKPEIIIEKEEYQNNSIITFGDEGTLRGVSVQQIRVYPVQYTDREITIYDKVSFRLTYGEKRGNYITTEDDLINSNLVNYKYAKKWVSRSESLNKPNLYTGEWYRFEVDSEGIYKLTKSDLESFGINLSGVDPRNIKIYGLGGKPLDELVNSNIEISDFHIPIEVVGESDGSFDNEDYILFYGRTSNYWTYDKTVLTNNYKRIKNFWDNHSYYYLNISEGNGKRIEARATNNSSDNVVQNETKGFYFYDKDDFNLGSSGRIYLNSDAYNQLTPSHTYMQKLDNIITGRTINYRFAFTNNADRTNGLKIYENNTLIRQYNLYGKGQYDYGRYFSYSFGSTSPIADDNRSVLKFEFLAYSSESKGNLDYFEIIYDKELKAINDSLIFFGKYTNKNVNYVLTNFSKSNMVIWDVTNFYNVKKIENLNINGGQCSFQVFESDISKYLAFSSDKFKKIKNSKKIEIKNIGPGSTGSKYVIITDKVFKEAAEKLASYRAGEAKYSISTNIFYVDEIFDEYSFGTRDPAGIRNFLKYAYENWSIKPEYVLLLGDGNFDNIDKYNFKTNFIPTYQTMESMSEIFSYPSDDFYGKVDGNDPFIDLSVGRITCSTLEEANNYIDKLIEYETEKSSGIWKNRITLVADDGQTTEGQDSPPYIHTRQSEDLTTYIPESYDINKIYLADYPEFFSSGGRRKPEVNQAIIDAINSGTLIFNYTGHGNPRVLAHEQVFVRETTIPQINNSNYFFLTAATCDFAKYDNPEEQSSAEELILMKGKGAIGVFGSARLVYSSGNAALNNYFYRYTFERDSNEVNRPIGLAFLKAKNSYAIVNSKKYHLFADPYLHLKIPEYKVSIDTINGESADKSIQIKALSKMHIKGRVLNPDNSLSNFDGEGTISVYDSKKFKLLDEISYTVEEQGGLIFRGKVDVSGGKFELGFVVPKDISYENKNGKVIATVSNEEFDGAGSNSNIIVGGTDTTLTNDKKGPSIEIMIDSQAESNNALVKKDFDLSIKLEDETGLNTTGNGIGHQLEGILNDNYTKPIDLSPYFVAETGSEGKVGNIKYKFSNLEEGDYKFEVKAWDVFNNPSSEEVLFTVVNSDGLTVRDVYNYPNPFSDETTFTFRHNISGGVNVKIRIYTIAGRLIKEIEEENINAKFVKIPWDGRDNDGDVIANGTYLYKLKVESLDGKYTDNILGKLSVIK